MGLLGNIRSCINQVAVPKITTNMTETRKWPRWNDVEGTTETVVRIARWSDNQMDLINLGTQSRKTGIRPKKNTKRDEYNMEDLDDFFNDEDIDTRKTGSPHKGEEIRIQRTLALGRTSVERSRRRSIVKGSEMVARKLEFHKKSPLLSPLQSRDEFSFDEKNYDLEIDNGLFVDEEHSPEKVKPNTEVEKRLNKQQQKKEQYLQELAQSDESDEDVVLPRPESRARKVGASLTKSMALGRTSAKKRRITPSPEPVNDAGVRSEEVSESEEEYKETQDTQESIPSPPSSPQRKTLKKLGRGGLPKEDGIVRKSSRVKVKPLAYWRNEKIVYQKSDNDAVPLQEIKEVVHVPDPTVESDTKPVAASRARVRSRSRSKTVSRVSETPAGEEISKYADQEESGWLRDGNVTADIFDEARSDHRVERTIAWAPDREGPGLPSKGSDENFTVAILFDGNKDFAASGVLEFPENGNKSLKTSGETYFLFHVMRGLLEVDISDTKFNVYTGCSFEVPMFNFYKFKNIGEGVAKLFFVQTKYVPIQVEEEWDEGRNGEV